MKVTRIIKWVGAFAAAMVLGCAVIWWKGRPVDPPKVAAYETLTVGLEDDEIAELRHFQQGAPLIWLGLLKGLRSHDSDQTIYGDLERFGFLMEEADDESNPHGLPTGFSVETLPGMTPPLPHISMSCTVCHTGEVHYGEHRMRIDGAPNLVDAEAWITHVDRSLAATMQDTWSAMEFFAGIGDYALQEPLMRAELPPIEQEEIDEFRDLLALRERVRVESKMKVAPVPSALFSAPQESMLSGDQLLLMALEDELKGLLSGGEEAGDKGLDKQKYPQATEQRRAELLSGIRRPFAAFAKFFRDRKAFNRKVKEAMALATEVGPGRDDPWGLVRRLLLGDNVPLTSPVSIPPLFNMEQWKVAHVDGNSLDLLDRNLAQGLALGGSLADDNVASIDPVALRDAAALFEKVEAPKWPEHVFGQLDQELVEKGRTIFHEVKYETPLGARSCADCHSSAGGEVYPLAVVQTDPRRLNDFREDLPAARDLVQRLNERTGQIKSATLKKRGVEAEEIYPDGSPVAAWATSKGYVARTLEGIWCSPPYLHNGSVRTLRSLLDPPGKRGNFRIGSRQFDPVDVGYVHDPNEFAYEVDVSRPGNSALGHGFGCGLSDGEKTALVEYLKSL